MSVNAHDLFVASVFSLTFIGGVLLGIHLSQGEQLQPAPEKSRVNLIPQSAIHRANHVRSI